MQKRPVNLSTLPVEEKLSLLERIYVKYPRSEDILNRIAYIHGHSRMAVDAEDCLLFTGLQGAGKTRLIAHYEKRFPRYETKKETREGIKKVTVVPVLTASIPAKATDKGLITELLYRLGDPFASVGSTTSLTLRLYELMEECGVEIVILDEFQHFIDRDSEKIRRNVANCLKDILIKTRKPVVLAGMPNSSQILDDNPQLNRRFSKRTSLDPLKWNPSENESCEFKMFLDRLDNALPFSERSGLSEHEMAFRIFCATEGVVAKVMKLTRRAAAFAISRSMDKVSLEDFLDAYSDQLADANSQMRNPFEDIKMTIKDQTSRKVAPTTEGTNKRVKPSANKPRASEILRRR